ncbi:MAG TPA: NlpC/P60 family protein [Acidimicrobiales bacterium]|nr:NlpC/P60 family protein [Acidimicrobiales bacterium]
MTTPRHRRLGIVSCALVLSTLVGAGGPTRAAFGDAIADKRAEAERIAKQLAAESDRVSLLAERLNQAQLKADQVAKQVKVAEGELAAADQELEAVRGRLRDRAVASYVQGGQGAGELPLDQLMASGSANDVVVRRAYVASVAGQEQATADALEAAQEVRRASKASLDLAKRSADALLADVRTQRQAAGQAVAAQRATLDNVQGELAGLVAAEQARRAAEEARRVQAELAARQAREEAARQAAEEARRAASGGLLGSSRATPADDGDAPPPASGAEAAVAEAKRQLGKPYEYGSPGPDSFDCSGLTSWAWRAGGRYLPHSSAAQYGATVRVPVSQVQPGDLLFFGSPIHHVGIYAGGGEMVEASETGTPVRMASIYRSDLVGVGRVG